MLILSLLVGVASAGSVDDPSTVIVPPPPELPPVKYDTSLDAGYQLTFSSNGEAFAPGPAVRISTALVDQNVYESHVALGIAHHALSDSSDLFDGGASVDLSGRSEFVTVSYGARAFPGQKEGVDPTRFRPWVGSDIGLLIAVWTAGIEGSPVTNNGANVHLYLDASTGVDVGLSRKAAIGVHARLGTLPGFRTIDEDHSKFEFMFLASAGPSFTLGF
jgi:hypothetical protein